MASYNENVTNFGVQEANRMALVEHIPTLCEVYIKRYGGPYRAAIRFIDDLMVSDPASFKRGYTRENAIIAALEVFPINREDLMEILDN